MKKYLLYARNPYTDDIEIFIGCAENMTDAINKLVGPFMEKSRMPLLNELVLSAIFPNSKEYSEDQSGVQLFDPDETPINIYIENISKVSTLNASDSAELVEKVIELEKKMLECCKKQH